MNLSLEDVIEILNIAALASDPMDQELHDRLQTYKEEQEELNAIDFEDCLSCKL